MNTFTPVLAFLEMNTTEIFFVVFLCLLFFGGTKLPELAKAMGQSIKEFKKAANAKDDQQPPAAQPPSAQPPSA